MDLKINFPPKKGKKSNYVFMDGGALHVPQDKFLSFTRMYINNVINPNEKICLVEECNSREFNYFLDIDYKDEHELSISAIKTIAKDITKLLNIGKCIVFVAPPRILDDDTIKSGIHIIWPGHVVNIETALEYRDTIIASMGEKWTPILDKSVYKTGLRLPWSYKYNRKTKKHELAYLPLCIVEKSGNIRTLDTKPDEHLFRLASIQVKSTNKREGWFSKTEMQNEIDDPDLQVRLGNFINKNVTGHEHTIIKNIYQQKGDYYLLNVNSTYCENKGFRHSSNHVYFVVNPQGRVYQKCFCRCDVIRKRGVTCENFRGQPYKLSGAIQKDLFPPT